MCGIAGIFTHHDKKIEYTDLEKMTETLRHRGPDGNGVWVDEDEHVGFGHQRLAILDLRDAGKQPMQYAKGRYTITYNGEIYNYVELRQDLIKRGYRFSSQTDTEVLLALYDLKKEKCLNDLDGMFAFAIWDKTAKKLFCARDRFGEKPFFYYAGQNKFVFASEMKALFKHGLSRVISPKRLHYYLTFGLEEDPEDISSTFFAGIRKLEAAHYMEVDAEGKIQIERYWDIDFSKKSNLSLEEASEQFHALLCQSIKRRLRSDVAVGSSLSGGLDSSAIVSIANGLMFSKGNQKTFSARFKDYAKDEGDYIQTLTDSLSGVVSHMTWPSEETLIEDLDRIFYHQEEPFGSASVFAQWEVMKLAKKNRVTVLLDGQGADEVLAGYISYYGTYLNQLYAQFDPAFEGERLKYSEFHGKSFQPEFKRELQPLQAANNEGKILSAQSKPDATAFGYYHEEFRNTVLSCEDPRSRHFQSQPLLTRQKNAIQKGSLQTILRFADRNSMAFSREVRLPFLNHELVEFAFSLPDAFKLFQGWTKYVFRKAMDKKLPDQIVWRKDKIGYEVPQASWLKNKKIQDLICAAREKLKQEQILSSSAGNFKDWECLIAAKLFS